MAKAKKEVPVDVKVRLDTEQIVDLSVAVEDFVDGLADSVASFTATLQEAFGTVQEAFKYLASDISVDTSELRKNLPGIPTYTTDDDNDIDDEVVCAPECSENCAGCPCREVEIR